MSRSLLIRLFVFPLFMTVCLVLGLRYLPDRFVPLHIMMVTALLLVDFALIHPPGIRQNIVIGFYSLFFGLSAVEFMAILLDPAPTTEETQTFGLYTGHPILGWTLGHPGVYHATRVDKRTGEVIYDATYTLEAGLHRRVVSAEDGPTVAFLGDSYAFGHGVSDADTMEQAYADLNGRRLRVLNFAVAGYGPQQYLKALEEGIYDREFGPNLKLIVISTLAWQIERSACKASYVMRSPRYRLDENGDVQPDGVCASGIKKIALEAIMNTNIYHRYLESIIRLPRKPDVDLYIALVARAATLAHEKYHVPVVVIYEGVADTVVTPTSGVTNAEIIARLRAKGAQVLDMDIREDMPPGAPTVLREDNHPTPLAQHARGVVLNRYIAEHLPELTAVPPPAKTL